MRELNEILVLNPTAGTSLGSNAYKIRIAIKSKGEGKSGGGRIITYVVSAEKEVYLLTIYDKSELDTISDIDLKKIIKSIQDEI